MNVLIVHAYEEGKSFNEAMRIRPCVSLRSPGIPADTDRFRFHSWHGSCD